ncbi:hypothetical protein WOLCODRAFT_77364 [Wolfiporia cocos MD-104 SS10]|uniref:Uncharacterized protein n=1 Tax=Wolfiporia cocos (strain MD-104) TaxID=742152 RepID=A0A2H3K747_WOLCO|nr:hypothetical protein WOLCODRAFT_77364 [Wolfiporia cocos MD-104 SS10]
MDETENTRHVGGNIKIITSNTPFQRLSLAVKHRSTSKMEDEAIILAITFGFGARNFTREDSDADHKMARFVTMMRKVPSDIIFLRGETIAHEPFRWCPRSLLYFSDYRLETFGNSGRCDVDGLHAQYDTLVLDNASRGRPHNGKFYARDKASGTKFELAVEHAEVFTELPQSPAFIFRTLLVGQDVAVMDIVSETRAEYGGSGVNSVARTGGRNDGKEGHVYKGKVVGYLKVMARGGSLIEEPRGMLSGALFSNLPWCIT